MSERIWKLTLTEPDEETRVRRVPQSKMGSVLQALFADGIPPRAELDVVEVPTTGRHDQTESRVAA